MEKVKNKFGERDMYTEEDIEPCKRVHIVNTACLTIQSEIMGWVSSMPESTFCDMKSKPKTIIVLGCQVTDLSVLHTLRVAAELRRTNPESAVLIGGCAAQRFDIHDFDQFGRVDLLCRDYQELDPVKCVKAVTWLPAFWDPKDGYLTGRPYRYLRIGKGCHGKCAYCTIRVTRKEHRELNIFRLKDQAFEIWEENQILVPTADTVSAGQIEDLLTLAKASPEEPRIALRNVEPSTLVEAVDDVIALAKNQYLTDLHVPIQSINSQVLEGMNRNPDHVYESLHIMRHLQRQFGVRLGTNLITGMAIDPFAGYTPKGNPLEMFSHISMNPYWAGEWDLSRAETRMRKHIPGYDLKRLMQVCS